jgi:hypothetical protein
MKINHQNWKPSNQLFYRKYHTSIKLGYFSYNSKPGLPIRYKDYRIVRRFIEIDQKWEIVCTIYTSDQNIIDFILNDDFYNRHIISMQGPINQDHIDALHNKDHKIIIRKNLWYNKYKYKMASWSNWRNQPSEEQYEDIFKCCYMQFKDSRVVHHYSGWHRNINFSAGFSPVNRRSQNVPIVYTNDQEQIFLFKLAYANILNIHIETVITHAELETDK